jgi:hypothetical protein
MGAKVRAWERAGRSVMRSPGRPPVGRTDHRRWFWEAIAEGASSEQAAVAAGVSGPVGVRWFREGGGMPSVCLAAPSARYLCFAEREEIALRRIWRPTKRVERASVAAAAQRGPGSTGQLASGEGSKVSSAAITHFQGHDDDE